MNWKNNFPKKSVSTGGFRIATQNFAIENITHKEIKYILAIQQYPLATYDQLAEYLQIPRTTVFDIAKRMESTYFVTAIPNFNLLKLDTVDVFIKADKQNKVKYLEELAKTHPHTSYYARTFGMYSGIYIQFRIPMGTQSHIETLLQLLKNQETIEDFTILQINHPMYFTTVDFDKWNFESLRWDFNWDEWFNLPLKEVKQEEKTSEENTPDPFTWLQKKDIAILTELMFNARRTNTKINQALKRRRWDLNASTLTRRLNRIKEDCIARYRVQIDVRIFDLLNTVLIWGYGDPDKIDHIEKRLKNHPIPFVSTFKKEQYLLYWYLHIPTFHLSELLFQLRQFMDEINFFYIDYPRAQTFSLETDAYDESIKDWRRDKAFFIDDVLQALEKIKVDEEK